MYPGLVVRAPAINYTYHTTCLTCVIIYLCLYGINFSSIAPEKRERDEWILTCDFIFRQEGNNHYYYYFARKTCWKLFCPHFIFEVSHVGLSHKVEHSKKITLVTGQIESIF